VGFGRGHLRQLRPHRNAGLEIVYVLRGTLVWQAEGRAEVVRPRSVFFSLPWQEHGSLLEFEPGHEWCYVILALEGPAAGSGGHGGKRVVRFPRSLGLREQDERTIARTLLRSRRHGGVATEAMAWVLPTLVAELQSPGPWHAERVRSLARLAVVELARSLETPGDGGSESRVASLIGTLSEACDRPWTLAEMAARCGVGRTRLAELLQLWTGDTPTQLLNRLRVERARRLLAESDDSITRIAQACGFETSQYFARVFRRFTGCDASSYRASRRGDEA
jgi:AraC family L-rhamnose operon regulatory protein RhaS